MTDAENTGFPLSPADIHSMIEKGRTLGLTDAEIAERLGLTPDELVRIESGADPNEVWLHTLSLKPQALLETMILAEGEKLVRELGWQSDPDDPNVLRRPRE